MVELEAALEALLVFLTLFVLVAGWIGLVIPIFPGLVIMWLGTLVYALVQAGNGQMTGWDWFLFAIITLLMIGGNIADNIIIARQVREKQVPWSSILIAFGAGIVTSMFFTPLVGMAASPAGLFLAEWRRLKDRPQAMANTIAWMKGWGWSIVARLGIGLLMIVLWAFWAFI